MANFGQKPWETLWKNLNFSSFLTSCFYRVERRLLVLEYRKTDFPFLYCQTKENRKMAIFGPKPWVNPFAKVVIFRLFERHVFIP